MDMCIDYLVGNWTSVKIGIGNFSREILKKLTHFPFQDERCDGHQLK